MGRKEIFITISISLFIVIFVVLFILSRLQPASNSKNTNNDSKTTVAATNNYTVSVNDIVNDPLVYDGLTLEVNSTITDWVTKRVFTVGSSGGLLGSGKKQLIVIRNKNFEQPKDTEGNELGIGETVDVHLRGKARIMDKIELGRAMGIDLDGSDIKLDDGNTDNWTEGTILLLDTVEKI